MTSIGASTTLADKISNGTIQSGHSLGDWLNLHFMNIILILIGGWLLHRFGSDILKRVISRTVRPDLYPTKVDREKRIKTLESLSKAVVKVGVYALAGCLIVGEINPSYTAALFASAGLVTVALGFGAKDLINDFMSGIFIITENQYRVGDFVEIAGVSGTVEDVTIRTTILRDLDGNVHHVPNGVIDVATNRTMGFSRLNEDLTLVVDSDLALVEHVINHVGEKLAAKADFAHSIKVAPHFTDVLGYTPTGITIKITGTVVAGEKATIKTEFYKLLSKAFVANDIELAGPLFIPHQKPKPTTATKKTRT